MTEHLRTELPSGRDMKRMADISHSIAQIKLSTRVFMEGNPRQHMERHEKSYRVRLPGFTIGEIVAYDSPNNPYAAGFTAFAVGSSFSEARSYKIDAVKPSEIKLVVGSGLKVSDALDIRHPAYLASLRDQDPAHIYSIDEFADNQIPPGDADMFMHIAKNVFKFARKNVST